MSFFIIPGLTYVVLITVTIIVGMTELATLMAKGLRTFPFIAISLAVGDVYKNLYYTSKGGEES